MILQGKVWRYGDNVDTDVIIPARYLNTSEPKELAVHCMEDIDTSFASKVRPGDIMVAGRNFGCGSSREHAPVALQASGISCVIAASFARIFYRNAINIGLPLIELPQVEEIKADDILSIDVSTGMVENKTSKKSYQAEPLPEFIQKIASAGGLINFIKEEG
jgi:3-isopropylmalate/(R)-2-methylmalate dehydratase small subunit